MERLRVPNVECDSGSYYVVKATSRRPRATAERRALQKLTDDILIGLEAMDKSIANRTDIPRPVSEWLGKWSNVLDMANDAARYHGLGVNFRRDDKGRALRAAKRRQGVA